MPNLPTPPYTEATIELAVKAIVEASWTSKTPGNLTAEARAVLDALVKAGLLLPEGAETRTEYGVEHVYPGLSPIVLVEQSRSEAERKAAPVAHFAAKQLMERTTWSTPWRPADAVRLAEGDKPNASDLQPEITTGDNRCSYCKTKDRDECPEEQL